jgi:hypothetical protein
MKNANYPSQKDKVRQKQIADNTKHFVSKGEISINLQYKCKCCFGAYVNNILWSYKLVSFSTFSW